MASKKLLENFIKSLKEERDFYQERINRINFILEAINKEINKKEKEN